MLNRIKTAYSAIAPINLAAPLVLVDIGAAGGLQPKWQKHRHKTRSVLFEPNPAEAARLRAAPDTIVIENGLSAEPGVHALISRIGSAARRCSIPIPTRSRATRSRRSMRPSSRCRSIASATTSSIAKVKCRCRTRSKSMSRATNTRCCRASAICCTRCWVSRPRPGSIPCSRGRSCSTILSRCSKSTITAAPARKGARLRRRHGLRQRLLHPRQGAPAGSHSRAAAEICAVGTRLGARHDLIRP